MKKHLSILLTLALVIITATGMTVFAAAETDVTYGDVNGDGSVNMKDVLVMRKYIAGIPVTIDLVAADTNGDDVVNMKDVLVMRKFVANIITEIPGGQSKPTSGPTQPVCYPENAVLQKSVLTRSDGYTFTYDANGNCTSERKYNGKNVDWQNSCDYTYDANGNCTGKVEYAEDGSVNLYSSRYYTYDENGNQISEKQKNADGTFKVLQENVYDENGLRWEIFYEEGIRLSSKVLYDINGEKAVTGFFNSNGNIDDTHDEWFIQGADGTVTVYRSERGAVCEKATYDTKGCLLTLRTFDEDGNVNWYESYNYTYDTNGNRTSCRAFDKNGDVYWDVQQYGNDDAGTWDATYDANGNQLTKTYYNEDGSVDCGLSRKYSYDANGNKVSERHLDENGNVREEITYDKNGNVLTETYYDTLKRKCTYDEDGNLVSEYKDGKPYYVTTYNANGQKTSTRQYYYLHYEDGAGNIFLNEFDSDDILLLVFDDDGAIYWPNSRDYVYDANGNLVKEIRYRNASRSYTACEYAYDSNGNLVSERHYQEENSENVDYEYTYDVNGNQTGYRKYTYFGTIDWAECWDATYNAKGEQTSYCPYTADGKKGSGWWDTTYDANGNKVAEFGATHGLPHSYVDDLVEYTHEYIYA